VKKYQFDCHTADGTIETSCTMDAASDDDASEIAKKLLLETECHAVEVRHKTILIHRAIRNASGQRNSHG
jgi:RNA-binding protein YhbY